MRTIDKEIKSKVFEATEKVVKEVKEVDTFKIKEVLEKDFKIKFFNVEVLSDLIRQALEKLVYIEC